MSYWGTGPSDSQINNGARNPDINPGLTGKVGFQHVFGMKLVLSELFKPCMFGWQKSNLLRKKAYNA